MNDVWGQSFSVALLGNVCWFQGDYDAAGLFLADALKQFRTLNDKWGSAFALYLLGFLHMTLNDVDAARPCFVESFALLQEIGDQRGQTRAYAGLGWMARSERQLNIARAHLEQALKLSLEVGDKWSAAHDLDELAGIATDDGQPELGARFLGAADALRQSIRAPLPVPLRSRYEHDLAVTRARLGKKAFEAAWAKGHQQSPEQASSALSPLQTRERSAQPKQGATANRILPPRFDLSPRELQVLRLVAGGLTDAQVAETLIISVRTVQRHLQSIYEKLGVSSRTAAARLASDHHLL